MKKPNLFHFLTALSLTLAPYQPLGFANSMAQDPPRAVERVTVGEGAGRIQIEKLADGKIRINGKPVSELTPAQRDRILKDVEFALDLESGGFSPDASTRLMQSAAEALKNEQRSRPTAEASQPVAPTGGSSSGTPASNRGPNADRALSINLMEDLSNRMFRYLALAGDENADQGELAAAETQLKEILKSLSIENQSSSERLKNFVSTQVHEMKLADKDVVSALQDPTLLNFIRESASCDADKNKRAAQAQKYIDYLSPKIEFLKSRHLLFNSKVVVRDGKEVRQFADGLKIKIWIYALEKLDPTFKDHSAEFLQAIEEIKKLQLATYLPRYDAYINALKGIASRKDDSDSGLVRPSCDYESVAYEKKLPESGSPSATAGTAPLSGSAF